MTTFLTILAVIVTGTIATIIVLSVLRWMIRHAVVLAGIVLGGILILALGGLIIVGYQYLTGLMSPDEASYDAIAIPFVAAEVIGALAVPFGILMLLRIVSGLISQALLKEKEGDRV